jgi:hypothetical protein
MRDRLNIVPSIICRRLDHTMKYIYLTLFAILLAGCGKSNPGYVVEGVYSTQEMGDPIAMYGICKVIGVRKDELVVCFPANFVQQRPTSVADFPTNAETIYFYSSSRDFKRKRPVFIGTLPLTERDKEKLAEK